MNGIDYTGDPRAVLIHFNPNHDKLGRFAENSFISGKSSTPVDKSVDSDYNKDRKIDKDKLRKYAKIGGVAVAGTLAVIGGAYLIKSGKLTNLINTGKTITRDIVDKHGLESMSKSIGGSGLDISDSANLQRFTAKSPDKIDVAMVHRINGPGPQAGPERQRNCAHCSLAYILNSMFGMNVEALPFSGVDEKSGLFASIDKDGNLVGVGRNSKLYDVIFDGIKRTDVSPVNDTVSGVLERVPPGTGILNVIKKTGGHFITYEKTSDGVITLIDGQYKHVMPGSNAVEMWAQITGYAPKEILDMTNATIRNDTVAKEVLSLMVK